LIVLFDGVCGVFAKPITITAKDIASGSRTLINGFVLFLCVIRSIIENIKNGHERKTKLALQLEKSISSPNM
jgi:hypothetical protein